MTALSKECSTPRASVRPRTLYQKIVDAHTVKKIDAGTVLLYCDAHFANEYTSPQAFAGVRDRGIPVAVPDAHLCVVDTSFRARTSLPASFTTTRASFRRKRSKPTAVISESTPSMGPMTRTRASSTFSWTNRGWCAPEWT